MTLGSSKEFIDGLNPNSLKVIQVVVEPLLATAKKDDKSQFERNWRFVADRVAPLQGAKPVFDLALELKNSWGKLLEQRQKCESRCG